jgi:hypothetical protein
MQPRCTAWGWSRDEHSRNPIPADGACIFTGRTAIYFGPEAGFDDGASHVLERDLSVAVCDKTAHRLEPSADPISS